MFLVDAGLSPCHCVVISGNVTTTEGVLSAVKAPRIVRWIALAAVVIVVAGLAVWGMSPSSGPTIGDASKDSPSPSTSAAPEDPIPAGVVAISDWQTTEQLFPDSFASLDALVGASRTYLQAGIKFPRPGGGVTIEAVNGGPASAEVHLLVKITGGSTEAMVGSEFKLVVRHDSRGWRLAPTGTSRVFCSRPLSGRSGQSCR
jgi:hypothetical protein